MAIIIQISEIQFRRGTEAELTANTLSSGEPAFAFDSGKLFIGSDPSYTGQWSTRAVSPYNNIEVLTEMSYETFTKMFDNAHRALGPLGIVDGGQTFQRQPYLTASLAPAGSWSPVEVNIVDQSTGLLTGSFEELVLTTASSMAGKIEYFLYDNAVVSQSGVLTCVHNGNNVNDVALTCDDNVAIPSAVGQANAVAVQNVFGTNVQFRVVRVTDGPSQYHFRIEYVNYNSDTYGLQLRAMITTD